MSILLAQKICIPGPTPGVKECFTGPIPTGVFSSGDTFTAADIVNRLVLFAFPIAGLILFINLLIAGFQLATSGGDPKKMESAKGRLTTSFLGFFLLFIAFWVTQIVAYIFGIKGLF